LVSTKLSDNQTKDYSRRVKIAIRREDLMMDDMQRLKVDYPWIQTPLVVGAPMRLIALADMAVEVSKAGKLKKRPSHQFSFRFL